MAVLDCAGGTGDLAFAFKSRVGTTGRVVGTDFCRPMIKLAVPKAVDMGHEVAFAVGDTLRLPFAADTFDISAIAFGIRNVDDPAVGLVEMARVVRPGGKVVVLEFGQPDGPVFGPLYRWYSRRIMPAVGGWLSGHSPSYNYLAQSAAAFPAGTAFVELIKSCGVFRNVISESLTLGIAHVYVADVA